MFRTVRYPIGTGITPAALSGDPHPLFHRLRAAEPVSWLPALNAWLVTKRPYAVEVMRDTKTYTVDHPGFSTAQVVGPSMLSLDGDEHQRHRAPFERPFRRSAVQKRFNKVAAVTCVTAGEPVSAAGRAAFAVLRESLLPALKRQTGANLLATAAGMADGLSTDQIVSNAAVIDRYAVSDVQLGTVVIKAGDLVFRKPQALHVVWDSEIRQL